MGTNKVKWQVKDIYGNKKICNQKIIVQDKQNPILICPPKLTYECTAQSYQGEKPLVIDNCGVKNISYTDYIFPLKVRKGNYINRWFAYDASGNMAKCEQKIKVVDTKAPKISCPPTETITTDTIKLKTKPKVKDECDKNPKIIHKINLPIKKEGTYTNTDRKSTRLNSSH